MNSKSKWVLSFFFATCMSCRSTQPEPQLQTKRESVELTDCTHTAPEWTDSSAWPIASLALGLVRYERMELEQFLAVSTEADASLVLARELIAARLNVAGVAVPSAATAASIENADIWMQENKDADGRLPYGTSCSDGTQLLACEQAASLTVTVAGFNGGLADGTTCGSPIALITLPSPTPVDLNAPCVDPFSSREALAASGVLCGEDDRSRSPPVEEIAGGEVLP